MERVLELQDALQRINGLLEHDVCYEDPGLCLFQIGEIVARHVANLPAIPPDDEEYE